MPETTRRPLIEVAKRYGVVACVSGPPRLRRAPDRLARLDRLPRLARLGDAARRRASPPSSTASCRLGRARQAVRRTRPSPRSRAPARPDRGQGGDRRLPLARRARRGGRPGGGGRSPARPRAPAARRTGAARCSRCGRRCAIDKGEGSSSCCATRDCRRACTSGDDSTDLDAFRGLDEARRAGLARYGAARRRARRTRARPRSRPSPLRKTAGFFEEATKSRRKITTYSDGAKTVLHHPEVRNGLGRSTPALERSPSVGEAHAPSHARAAMSMMPVGRAVAGRGTVVNFFHNDRSRRRRRQDDRRRLCDARRLHRLDHHRRYAVLRHVNHVLRRCRLGHTRSVDVVDHQLGIDAGPAHGHDFAGSGRARRDRPAHRGGDLCSVAGLNVVHRAADHVPRQRSNTGADQRSGPGITRGATDERPDARRRPKPRHPSLDSGSTRIDIPRRTAGPGRRERATKNFMGRLRRATSENAGGTMRGRDRRSRPTAGQEKQNVASKAARAGASCWRKWSGTARSIRFRPPTSNHNCRTMTAGHSGG